MHVSHASKVFSIHRQGYASNKPCYGRGCQHLIDIAGTQIQRSIPTCSTNQTEEDRQSHSGACNWILVQVYAIARSPQLLPRPNPLTRILDNGLISPVVPKGPTCRCRLLSLTVNCKRILLQSQAAPHHVRAKDRQMLLFHCCANLHAPQFCLNFSTCRKKCRYEWQPALADGQNSDLIEFGFFCVIG
jgi:hypothetical protein